MNAQAFNATETLADGEVVRIRALRPEDKDGLVGWFGRLSPQSIYKRFLGPRGALKEKELDYLTDLDFRRRVALAATLERHGEEAIVGISRFMVAPGDHAGRPELAIAVEDAEQHRGIGTLLLRHLIEIAWELGIPELEAHILAENDQMIAFLPQSGTDIARVTEDGVTSVAFRIDEALRQMFGGD